MIQCGQKIAMDFERYLTRLQSFMTEVSKIFPSMAKRNERHGFKGALTTG